MAGREKRKKKQRKKLFPSNFLYLFGTLFLLLSFPFLYICGVRKIYFYLKGEWCYEGTVELLLIYSYCINSIALQNISFYPIYLCLCFFYLFVEIRKFISFDGARVTSNWEIKGNTVEIGIGSGGWGEDMLNIYLSRWGKIHEFSLNGRRNK